MRHSAILWTLPLLCLTACARPAQPLAPETAATAGDFALPAELRSDPHTGFLAAADLTIDRASGTVDLAPVRDLAAIGDAYSELGLGPAFRETFGKNFEVVGLRSTGPTTIEIDFRTTHPFQPANRPDLAIFNLKCWLVTDLTPVNVGGVDVAPGLVTNADGYGRMWTDTAVTQPAYTAATLQPYVILHEDPTCAPFDYQNPAGFNVFFPGTVSTDTVALDLGTASTLQVRIYLTADYGQSAVRATRQTPAYELPKFAGNAAWKVEVAELANDLETGVTTSTASYQVDIWDWKHGAALGSDVDTATIDIPGVTASPQTLALSGTGADPTPLTATALVTNALGALDGTYWGVVTVTDQATSGVGLDETFAPVSLTGYTTYALFPVIVSGPVGVPPTAAITSCTTTPIRTTLEVQFDASTSTPGTYPITTYEWDFDYTAPTFDVMATGAITSYAYPTTGTFTAAVRVSDGFGNSDIGTYIVPVAGTPSWGTPTRLTNNNVLEQLGYWIQECSQALAVGPDGTAHLVWSTVETVSPFRTLYWYTNLPNTCSQTTGWTAPENFYTTPPSQQLSMRHNVLVTSDNAVHVLCPARNGSSLDAPVELIRTGVTWSAPQTIMTAPGVFTGLRNFTLAADPADNLACLAVNPTTQPSCPGTPAVPWNIVFAKKSSGTWQPQSVIAPADMVVNIGPSCGVTGNIYFFGASLAATSTGDWIAVWDNLVTPFDGFTDQNTGPTKLNWVRTTGGVWGTPATLYTSATQYRHPMLQRAPDGTVWLAARMGVSTSTIGLARYAGAAWDADMTAAVTHAGGSTAYYSLDFDAEGRGSLILSHQNSNVALGVKRFQQTDTPAAIGALAEDLVEPTSAIFRYPADVASLHDGRYVAVWSTSKYNSTFWTGFELDAALWQ